MAEDENEDELHALRKRVRTLEDTLATLLAHLGGMTVEKGRVNSAGADGACPLCGFKWDNYMDKRNLTHDSRCPMAPIGQRIRREGEERDLRMIQALREKAKD